MTMMQTFGLIALLSVLAALVGRSIVQSMRTEATIRLRFAAEQRVRDRARCEAIEVDLREWLQTLQLPILEDQTRLEEAARQLRIVLVEQLMRGPRVR